MTVRYLGLGRGTSHRWLNPTVDGAASSWRTVEVLNPAGCLSASRGHCGRLCHVDVALPADAFGVWVYQLPTDQVGSKRHSARMYECVRESEQRRQPPRQFSCVGLACARAGAAGDADGAGLRSHEGAAGSQPCAQHRRGT
jgi:hypothetical protein